MEVTMQHDQTKKMELAYQQSPTQTPSPRLIVKDPKMRVYNKRRSSEALGASSHQDILKKMNITSSSQIVDLEEEEPKEKTYIQMIECMTKNEEVGMGNKT